MELLRLEGKHEVSVDELLAQIVELSYMGDIRMALGIEPKDKIAAIVKGQHEGLRAIYDPLIQRYNTERNSDFIRTDIPEFRASLSQRVELDTPVYSHTTLVGHIAAINRKTSTRMAVSQLIAGHPLKNVC